MGLSPAQVEAFRREGFLFPLPAMAPARAAALVDWLDALERRHAGIDARTRRHRLLRFKPHMLFPELDAVVHAPAVLDAVESVLGPDILIWASAFFIKEPGDPAFVSWHQDSATYGLDGDALLTAWIAMSDAGIDNAAMRFAPQSHRLGPLPHRDTEDAANMLSRGETVELEIDEDRAVDVVLAAGEMSFHHIDLAHGSGANRSSRRRIGYAVRYMSPAMRPRLGPASAMLARGRDTGSGFEMEPRPIAEDHPATRAAWERAIALRERTVFGA
ncbi:MAG: phytanoyl-CoA dioxygenase family protein [Alphaproteobacteria bacterium]|nr:phytanoyl-CoA dioxygenase family protein [Alphaproteobacteria bacterium]